MISTIRYHYSYISIDAWISLLRRVYLVHPSNDQIHNVGSDVGSEAVDVFLGADSSHSFFRRQLSILPVIREEDHVWWVWHG